MARSVDKCTASDSQGILPAEASRIGYLAPAKKNLENVGNEAADGTSSKHQEPY